MRDADEGSVRFEAARVSGVVQPLGGMLGPARFDLGGGRTVEPFAVAPWTDEPGLDPALPAILKRLRGEWPCVPFGMPDSRRDLPADWLAGLDAGGEPIDPHPHGYGSNHDWTLTPESASGVLLAIGYPAPHPVRWLERTVRGDRHAAAIDFTLTVHARRDTALPVGLHPTFRLPDEPAGARLVLGGADPRAWTFPVDAEPGRSRVRPDARAVPPNAIPAAAGGTVDLAALDLAGDSEDLILLTGTEGRVALDNRAEGYRVVVTWDAAVLPSCLLWISNRGRRFPPWNGRFRAIGIEPVAAPFDLGVATALNPANPLAAAGIACSVAFRAGRPWTTAYRIACEALD